MKRIKKLNSFLFYGFIVGFFTIASCNEDENLDPGPVNDPKDTTDVEHPDDDPGYNSDLNANEIHSSIILQNATIVNGNIPPSSNLADLKLDKDTIFLVEGFKNRIRIKYPESGIATGSSHFYIQVEGANTYYDVQPEEEESNDTIGVFYMEFDPGDFEPPFSFNIKLAPHDGSGLPIEEIEVPVAIEKKGGSSCSPSYPNPNWDWIYTYSDGNFFPAPGHGWLTEGKVNGCCLEGYTVDCIANGIGESDWISLDYTSSRVYQYEIIQFSDRLSEFVGTLDVDIQNIDPSESDFCNGKPSYNNSGRDHAFWGDYTYDPSSGQVQLTNLEVRSREVYLEELDMTVTEYDWCFLSADYLYEIISCHFLMETSSIEGATVIRIFERRANPDTKWYD